jgi:hypothetical protein
MLIRKKLQDLFQVMVRIDPSHKKENFYSVRKKGKEWNYIIINRNLELFPPCKLLKKKSREIYRIKDKIETDIKIKRMTYS